MAKRLTRDTDNAMLGGVAAGYADYLGLDPVLVRLGFVLLVFLHGAGVILYLASWAIMPVRKREAAPPPPGGPEPAPGEAGFDSGEAAAGPEATPTPETASTPVDRFVEGVREAGEKAVETIHASRGEPGQARLFAGFFLIIVGLVFLADRLFWFHWPWWLSFSKLWPLILVVVGVVMILGRAGGRDRRRERNRE